MSTEAAETMTFGSLEVDPLSELFGRLAAGDRQALAELYDLTSRQLFGLAFVRTGSRGAAEEVVQETFARLAATRADLARVRHPRAYLLATVRRVAADLTRRERRTEPLEAESEELLIEPGAADPVERLDRERARAALRRLSPKLREAVTLRYLEELSLREVAAATGVPLFTAASRCRLGLAWLRSLLSGRSR